MFFLRSFAILVFSLIIYDGSSQNYPSNRNFRISITPGGKIQNSSNLTIYLGYANKPFGPLTPPNVDNKKALLLQQLGNRRSFSSEPSLDNKIESLPSQEQRSKRGVINLYNMVSCATGCNPLIYKGYGCYCGFLGSGYAVDGIDRCCQDHDWCYNTANCPMYLEYFVPYYWTCYRNRSFCAIPQDQPGGLGSCAQRLCECDRLLSECLGRYPCPSRRAICKSSPWRLIQNALMGF